MKKYKKGYYFLNLLGAILLIFILMITYYRESNLFFDFSVVIISFGLSIPITFVINQYMEIRQYNFINTLALNSIFKMMLIMIHFYVRAHNQPTDLEMFTLFLQCYLLDLSSLIVSYYLTKKYRDKRISTHIVTLTFILIVAVSGILEIELVKYLLRASIVFGIVVSCAFYIKWKWISHDVLYERFHLFRVVLIYMIINHVVGYFYVWKIEEYRTIMIAFQFIHVLYLFICAYSVCISSPWEKRMYALNIADKQIYEQCRNCDMIVNLSHELKTPVNVIRSTLDILKLDFDNSDILENIKSLKKDCNILMSIIQDMIDIQKMNGHHIELKYETYNLVEVIEYVIDAFSEEVSESQLIFNPKEEEINTVIDGILMQQCFMLLLGMLIQYDYKKKIFVEISQQQEQEYISIKMVHVSIPYLKNVYEQMNMLDKKVENVADILTLRLIHSIIMLHEGEMAFGKEQNEKELWIYLKRKEEGEVTWLDNRSMAVLNDKIRCRYVGG